MINTNILYSFGQTVFDSSLAKKKSKIKFEAKDPDEDQIVEGFEGDCEQCEIEKLKKPCSICEE